MKRIIILVVVCLVASSAQADVDDVLIGSDHTAGHAWIRDEDLSDIGIFQTAWGPLTTSGVQSDHEWVLGSSAGNLFLRNPDISSILVAIDCCGTINTLAVSINDNVLVGSAEGDVYIRNPDLSSVSVTGGWGNVTAIGVQSNGDFVFGTAAGNMWRYDSTFTTQKDFEQGFGTINTLAVSDNDNVIVSTAEGNVFVRNPDLSSAIVVAGGPFGNIVDIVTQSDNDFAFAADTGNAWLFDSTGTVNKGFVNGLGPLSAMAVQSDDDLVIASDIGNVWVFDPALSPASKHFGGGGAFGSVVTLSVQVPPPGVLVDDMEDYDLFGDPNGICDPNSNDICKTWVDGNVLLNGSRVTTQPDGADSTAQAMQFQYSNNGTSPYGFSVSSFYSEIVANTSDLECGSDWTTNGVAWLKLQFKGDPSNDVNERMYMVIEDSVPNAAMVQYGLPDSFSNPDFPEDMNDITLTSYQTWGIDLRSFSGVALNDIQKVYIGFGTRGNTTTPGGTGTVMIDEIRLIPPGLFGTPDVFVSDLNNDGVVDFEDFAIFASQYLLTEWDGIWPIL